MSNKSYEERKEILVRNVFACVFGMLVVLLFVFFAPLYDIFEEFKITYIDKTLSQIMTRYVFVIVVASFVLFGVGFYISKLVMLKMKERNARKIVEKHKA